MTRTTWSCHQALEFQGTLAATPSSEGSVHSVIKQKMFSSVLFLDPFYRLKRLLHSEKLIFKSLELNRVRDCRIYTN